MFRGSPTQALLAAAVTTFSALVLVWVPQAWATPPTGSVLLELPPVVTIQLTSGQEISGVRLMVVSSSEIRYEKGGIRLLPPSEVKIIRFRGKMVIEGPDKIWLGSIEIGPTQIREAEFPWANLLKPVSMSHTPSKGRMFQRPSIGPKTKPLYCPESIKEMLVDASAVTIQSDGTKLGLLLPQKPKKSLGSTLILHQLRFDRIRNLRIGYKACSPRE
jgi:hypothetical protein